MEIDKDIKYRTKPSTKLKKRYFNTTIFAFTTADEFADTIILTPLIPPPPLVTAQNVCPTNTLRTSHVVTIKNWGRRLSLNFLH